MRKIGVYGSLKKGFYNHGFLAGANPQGKAILRGYTLHSLGAYPAVVAGSPKDLVGCEIYEVDPNTFSILDRMERGAGYIQVEHPDGFIFWAFPESYGYPQVPPDSSGVAVWREK